MLRERTISNKRCIYASEDLTLKFGLWRDGYPIDLDGVDVGVVLRTGQLNPELSAADYASAAEPGESTNGMVIERLGVPNGNAFLLKLDSSALSTLYSGLLVAHVHYDSGVNFDVTESIHVGKFVNDVMKNECAV